MTAVINYRFIRCIQFYVLFCRNFVHDPKMANEPTVSASVKLQYTGRNGDRYVVSRCMEAKQMAKTISGMLCIRTKH